MPIVNLFYLRPKLIASLHLPRRFNSRGWDDLEYACARFRRDTGRTKSMFRRGMTWRYVLDLINETIASPDIRPYLHYGKWIAIRTFNFDVGQQVKFSKRRNHPPRLTRQPLYRVKVVFTEVRQGRYRVTTAHPC